MPTARYGEASQALSVPSDGAVQVSKPGPVNVPRETADRAVPGRADPTPRVATTAAQTAARAMRRTAYRVADSRAISSYRDTRALGHAGRNRLRFRNEAARVVASERWQEQRRGGDPDHAERTARDDRRPHAGERADDAGLDVAEQRAGRV
jgi:hypothetical protein